MLQLMCVQQAGRLGFWLQIVERRSSMFFVPAPPAPPHPPLKTVLCATLCCYAGLPAFPTQACYSLICTLSMPTWVLHGDCVEPKVFWKKFILGSGILIGTWLGCVNACVCVCQVFVLSIGAVFLACGGGKVASRRTLVACVTRTHS